VGAPTICYESLCQTSSLQLLVHSETVPFTYSLHKLPISKEVSLHFLHSFKSPQKYYDQKYKKNYTINIPLGYINCL
jgi:hypothetical protein